MCQRGSTGFELTDEGSILAEACRGFSDTIREFPAGWRTSRLRCRGHLRIMLVSNLVVPALDDAIAAFHASYPAVEIIVEVAAWTDVVNSLMQHRVDVGIAPSRVKRAELAYLHLFTEVHRPYCGRTHRLFGKHRWRPVRARARGVRVDRRRRRRRADAVSARAWAGTQHSWNVGPPRRGETAGNTWCRTLLSSGRLRPSPT